MKRKLSVVIFFAAVTMLGFVVSAGAVDGVIEINQAKVMAAGGFPYVIGKGSYRLTSNLTVSGASTDAIDIAAGGVTLDLNGFAIVCVAVGSSGNGISSTFGEITIENGTITAFGRGVSITDQSIVRNVHADLNTNVGIGVDSNSIVQSCTANLNGNYGIVATGSGNVISGNTANNTSGIGIGIYYEGGVGLVIGNVAADNPGTGLFFMTTGGGYRENVLAGNANNVAGGVSMGNNLCGGVVC